MLCRSCGQMTPDGSDICAHCGKDPGAVPPTGANPIRVRQLARERESEAARRNLIVAFIVVVVLAAFIVVVWHQLGKSKTLEEAVRSERIDIPGYLYYNWGELLDDICPDAVWDYQKTTLKIGSLKISGKTRYTGKPLEIVFSVYAPNLPFNDWFRLRTISYGSDHFSVRDNETYSHFLRKILDKEFGNEQ